MTHEAMNDLDSQSDLFLLHAAGSELNAAVTTVILFTGVIGGLLIVITVLFVCKYCMRRQQQRPLQRHKAFFRRSSSPSNEGFSQFEALEGSALKSCGIYETGSDEEVENRALLSETEPNACTRKEIEVDRHLQKPHNGLRQALVTYVNEQHTNTSIATVSAMTAPIKSNKCVLDVKSSINSGTKRTKAEVHDNVHFKAQTSVSLDADMLPFRNKKLAETNWHSLDETSDAALLTVHMIKEGGASSNNNYNTDSGVDSETESKQSGNQLHSNNANVEQQPNESSAEVSSESETLNGEQQYRDLWRLRYTLEDQPMNDASDNSVIMGSDLDAVSGCKNRQEYYRNIWRRNILVVKNRSPKDGEGESFDSIETNDTDCDLRSDTSRTEFTTTSFDSMTDNPDSSGEGVSAGAHGRLVEMRGDSGYKSLETSRSLGSIDVIGTPPNVDASVPSERRDSLSVPAFTLHGGGGLDALNSGGGTSDGRFDRHNGKTASRKRREYHRDRHAVQVCESLAEDNPPSGDSSFDDSTAVLPKILLKSKNRKHIQAATRDFSVDEKTHNLFMEFVRHDPAMEKIHFLSPRSPRTGRRRLHRKQTEPVSTGTVSKHRDKPLRSHSLQARAVTEEETEDVMHSPLVASPRKMTLHDIPKITLQTDESCSPDPVV